MKSFGMLRPQHPLVDDERAAEQRLRLGVAALGRAERTERGESGGHFRMIGSEPAFRDGKGAAEQRLGRGVLALGLVRGREEAQAQGDPWVLRPEALGALQRGREESLGLGVAAQPVGPIARGHGCLPALPVGGGLGGDRGRAQGQRDHHEGGREAGGEAGDAVPANCASRRG